MTEKSIHISAKTWHHIVKACILISVCLFLGSVISFFSPYVTLDMEPLERFEFWIILCLVGGTGIFIFEIILSYFAKKIPKYVMFLFQSLGGTVAVLMPLYWIYDPSEIPPFGTSFIFVWLIVILILAGTALMFNFVNSQSDKRKNYSPQEPKASAHNYIGKSSAKILNRLPENLQNSELYALSADDHYVRVYTSQGNNLILMRLSDAIAEAGTFEGMQTHRSWWVAKAAIDKINPKGRTAEIILKNQIVVPISRNALKPLREAGWL